MTKKDNAEKNYIALVNAEVWVNKLLVLRQGESVEVPKEFIESLELINYIKQGE